MNKNLRWKVLGIVGITLIAAFAVYPPDRKIKLGLDLKGGVHMVMKVQTDDALRLESETTMDRLREELQKSSIPVTVELVSPTTFKVQGVPPAQDQAFRRVADAQTSTTFNRDASGAGEYTFTVKPNVAQTWRNEAVAQAIRTIERRVNEFGVAEPIVAPHGAVGDQILVQLPGVTDVSRAKDIVQKTAMLELKLVEEGPASTKETLLTSRSGAVPPDMEVVMGTSDPDTGGRPEPVYYLVRKVAAVTGRDLRNARPSLDENNQPAVQFTLKGDGIDKFGKVTGENIGRYLAIILDDTVQSAPRIEGRITDDGRISGSFTQQEAADLALTLRSGALPASLSYLEQRTVGPTLGADSIRAGIMASIVGLVLVALFMLSYYKLSGINALLSIVLNLLILLAFMSYLGAVMTLPGIAGFILTIGMGVDSNVLIFERIKEELRTAKGVKAAVAAGFDRVFLTILDTHVASLIAAAFLFQFGTGAIRGFATTLTFGLLSNVFTSVFVSRTLFELILSRRQATTLSI